MADYKGPADLVFGERSHQGQTELMQRTGGWEGWFEFANPVSVEEWQHLMLAASADFAGWPAKLELPDGFSCPAMVEGLEGQEMRVKVSGEGTPWEAGDMPGEAM